MTDRLACVVPFCGHTTGRYPEATEWICADHWRRVEPKFRRLLSRLRRRIVAMPEKSPDRAMLFRVRQHLWGRVKRQAIERAAGITA